MKGDQDRADSVESLELTDEGDVSDGIMSGERSTRVIIEDVNQRPTRPPITQQCNGQTPRNGFCRKIWTTKNHY